MELTAEDRALLAALEDGLPLVPRPYAEIGAAVGLSERRTRERLAALRDNGVISRFGVVVRHRELGYRANAMTVWDVSDDRVDEAGRAIAAMPGVTLCYRRPRRRPDWPYNLFCMVHGRNRAAVEQTIEQITRKAGLDGSARAILFSRRRFKQRGARYDRAPAPDDAVATGE